jgi:hypothetical protein
MGIIQTFTEQDVRSLHGTLLYMVESSMADETMASAEGEVGVVRRETRKSIEHMAIDGYRYRCRKHGTFLEGKLVGIVIV